MSDRIKARLPLILGTTFILLLAVVFYFFRWTAAALVADRSKWQSRDSQLQDLESNLHALADRIKSLQGQSSCRLDSDCRVVGVGTNTCGEFKDFVVYSTRDTDEPKLLQAIQSFNEKFHKASDLSLAAEKCGTKPAPVRCVKERCTPDVHGQ